MKAAITSHHDCKNNNKNNNNDIHDNDNNKTKGSWENQALSLAIIVAIGPPSLLSIPIVTLLRRVPPVLVV